MLRHPLSVSYSVYETSRKLCGGEEGIIRVAPQRNNLVWWRHHCAARRAKPVAAGESSAVHQDQRRARRSAPRWASAKTIALWHGE